MNEAYKRVVVAAKVANEEARVFLDRILNIPGDALAEDIDFLRVQADGRFACGMDELKKLPYLSGLVGARQ